MNVGKKGETVVVYLDQENGIDAAVVLGIVGHLGIFAPDNLASGGDKTELGHVDFQHGSLGDNAELGVEGRLRILLDTNDR